MGRSIAEKKKATKRSKRFAKLVANRAMSTAVRFAEEREGKRIGIIQGEHFAAMMNTAPLALNEWAHAVFVSPRTMQNRIRENKPFDALQSDRMVLIMHVMERGKEVFGDAGKFRRWLDAPRPTFGGRKPVERLNDLVGIGEVLAELGRIEHGVF